MSSHYPVGMPGPGGMPGECQVCGQSFLCDIVLGRKCLIGRVEGIETPFALHQKCEKYIKDGMKWEDLPEGPLRRVFQEAHARETKAEAPQ